MEEWVEKCKEMKIPCSKEFSIRTILGNAVTIREWGIHGLPIDSFSIENAII